MRAVVQRVTSACLTAEGVSRRIGPGLVVLVGIEAGDADSDRVWIAGKLPHLRVFEDEQGKMNRSVLDLGGSILLVPNFTLSGDASKGRRPSFDRAMPPAEAGPEFDRLADAVLAQGARVETGVFRAHMTVELTNDGPVTLWLDSRNQRERSGAE